MPDTLPSPSDTASPSLRFAEITPALEPHVDRIFAGEQEQYWLYTNRTWLELSRQPTGIECRLVFAAGIPEPVGMVAWGPFYRDSEFSERVEGRWELYHLVIDQPHQRQGYGRRAALWALDQMRARPGCRAILVAHHPVNLGARRLYLSLGFVDRGETDFDGDPLLEMPNQES